MFASIKAFFIAVRLYLALLALAGLIGLAIYGYHHVDRQGYDRAKAEDALVIASQAQAIDKLRTDNSTKGREVEVRYITKTEKLAASAQQQEEYARDYIKTHPVQFACAVDADGLRQWNDAGQDGGAGVPAPAQPDGPLPDPAEGGRRQVRHLVFESSAGRDDGQGLSRAAGSAERLDTGELQRDRLALD